MAIQQKDTKLRRSVAPNLPIGPVEYQQQFQDQYSNALRQYFAQIDNASQALLGVNGGGYLRFPNIAATDTTIQYATADNTPTKVNWNTFEHGSGFTLNANMTATASVSGIYKVDYSLQLANTDNLIHDVAVWAQITDGTTYDEPRSASIFTVAARKSAGIPTYLIAYSSIVFSIRAGESVALWWATDKAYNTVGPVEGVYMPAIAAQTVPYTRPASPSAVGSITFVSAIPT